MTESKRSSQPPSGPSEDLKRERDAFVEQFFRKGAKLTEEILEENKRLRQRIADLEAENLKLRAHLASDSAMRELLKKIEQLEAEKLLLVSQSSEMETVSNRYSARFAEVEDELAHLANLYVAVSSLHSAHTVRGVLRTLKELLAQFVGAASYAVYFATADRKQLFSIASEGVIPADIARISAEEGPIGETFLKGDLFCARGVDTSAGTAEAPAAVIPLQLDGRVIGAISIFATLTQKTEFFRVDSELFKLLGEHAASALVSARLFTDSGRKVPPEHAFLDAED